MYFYVFIFYTNALFQKAHARLRALNLSTTLSNDDKEKIRPVLKADFMSSDESDVNNSTRSGESSDSDSGGNGRPHPEQTQRKKAYQA